MEKIKIIKFIGLFLLVLLAIFICYGIYYAVIVYLFFIKMIAIAACVASLLYFYLKFKSK